MIDFNLAGGETGMDLAGWMREQPALQHTVRISYSGSDVRSRLSDKYLYHHIVTKPVPLATLLEEILYTRQQSAVQYT